MSTRALTTTSRRSFSSSSSLLIRVTDQAVVKSLSSKKTGDPVTFGEPLAELQVANETTSIPAPVTGEIVRFAVHVGEVLKPDAEFGMFRGRRPLIEFRHLKGPQMRFKVTQVEDKGGIPVQQQKQQPEMKKQSQSVSVKTIFDLPPNYGRLPPLSPKEVALLQSGGAYDAL